MKYCYHYDVDDGRCRKCGTAVTVTSGHTVRVSLFGAESEPYGVWVGGVEAPSVTAALSTILGVSPSAIVLRDAAPHGEYWDRTLRVVWSLTGSRVDIVSRVTVTPAERKSPEHTEVDDDYQPLPAPEPEAAEA